MKTFRNLRVASLVEHELNKLFLQKLEFENALVTITAVEVSSDLLQAKVRLGVIPFEKGPEIFKLLEKRKKELQYRLLRKINIKPMPSLKFEIENPQKVT